jgi:hypothetical protein
MKIVEFVLNDGTKIQMNKYPNVSEQDKKYYEPSFWKFEEEILEHISEDRIIKKALLLGMELKEN